MKKGIGLALLCMLLLFNVWSKGNGDAGSDRKVPMATLLGGNETVSEVVEELKNAGLSNTDVFQNRVLDYAATAGRNAGLEDGWVLPSELTVDTAKCMDGWESTHDYSDANCRMTAFLLLEGLITAERVEETYTGTYLMFDMEAIDATEKYERIKENRALFTTLFGDKTVSEGKEPQNIYSEAWEDFGLKVRSNQVSMLSLVIYDPYFQTTFVGHTGVLLNYGDHMLFIEKIAFEQPYQATKIYDLTELLDMLSKRAEYFGEEGEQGPFVYINGEYIGELKPHENNAFAVRE